MSTTVAATRSPRIALLFAALCAAFFAPGIFGGQAPVFRDLLILVIPLRGYAREAIRSGHLPLWCSELFFGAPFLANYQSAVLYPPSAILYVLPFPLGVSVFLAFHLLVAGLGMFRFLHRRLGLAPEASLLGATVFAFGGFFVSLVPLTNQLEVAAWLPWALEAAEELGDNRSARPFVRLTLFLALQALGGAPEAFLLSLALVVADAIRLASRRGTWRILPRIGAAALLACALAAFQLSPTVEYILRTDRASVLAPSLAFAESLAPVSLWQLIMPHRFLDGAPAFIPEGRIPIFWSIYLGIAPLALALLGGSRRDGRFWSATLICGVVLALGDSLPVLPALYRVAPALVGAFRYPAKLFLIAHAAAAVLVALATDACLRERFARKLVLAGLFVIFAAEVSFTILAKLSPEAFLDLLGFARVGELSSSALTVLAREVEGSSVRGGLFAVVTMVALGLFHVRRIRSSVFGALLVAIAVADLLPLHQPTLVFSDWGRLQAERSLRRDLPPGSRVFHYCTKSPGCLPFGAPGIGPWQGTLRPGENAEDNARFVAAAWTPNLPMLEGVGAVAGSDGLSTRDQREFFRALALLPRAEAVHLLAALGVDRLIGPEPLADEGVGEPVRVDVTGRIAWSYPVRHPAPRAYLADRVVEAADLPAALARLASEGFHSGHDAVSVGEPGAEGPKTAGGTIEELSYGARSIRIRASLPDRGLLVVASSFFPGWDATIDGQRSAIVRANGVLSGVWVPGGTHQIELRYSSRWFSVGWAISLAAAACLLAIRLRARPGSLTPP